MFQEIIFNFLCIDMFNTKGIKLSDNFIFYVICILFKIVAMVNYETFLLWKILIFGNYNTFYIVLQEGVDFLVGPCFQFNSKNIEEREN